MSFSPERVDVWVLNYDATNKCADLSSMTTDRGTFDGDRFVLREDYDQLLEMWREEQRELRMARGLKALLANGMPPTGNPAFDEILATHPIAAMIQRGWLGAVAGFEDLPSLEWEICHFYGVKTIEEAVSPRFPPEQP